MDEHCEVKEEETYASFESQDDGLAENANVLAEVDIEVEHERLKSLASEKFKEKKFLEALDYYDQACKLTVQGVRISVCKSNASQCCINVGKFDDAVRYASEALTIDPQNIKSLYRRGLALDSLGEYAPALEDFNRALISDGGNKHLAAEAKRMSDKLGNLLNIAAKTGDLNPFIALMKLESSKVVDFSNVKPSLHLNLGTSYGFDKNFNLTSHEPEYDDNVN